MKSVLNRLSLIFIFLFTAALIFTAYYLYIFPDRINKGSVLVDQETIKSLAPVFTELNIVMWSALILALVAIMLQLFNNNSTNSDLLFDEKEKENAIGLESEFQQIQQDVITDQRFSIKEYEKILEKNNDLKRILNKVLWTVCKELEASQAAIYRVVDESETRYIELFATFAYSVPDSELIRFEFGEGLAGQVAKEGRTFNIDNVPEGYIKVISGLGNASPNHLLILPVAKNDNIMGVMEIASFKVFDKDVVKFLEKLSTRMAEILISKQPVESINEQQNQ
ncbi:MAG: GAF domain-containing protein [Cyclobacteriaceae bacterium]